LKKVVEEAGEFTFAVKDKDEKEIIYEGADLIFHFLVALASQNIHPERIEQELKRRMGTSGIEEKKNRPS
jgi:phosphoribosyl-ATP pyrophosphohydrolase/phosphoribosyl-AMP cyclohydrolase